LIVYRELDGFSEQAFYLIDNIDEVSAKSYQLRNGEQFEELSVC